MKVFIVYAHPSEDSFTRHVRDSFVKGLEAAGHSYMMSNFLTSQLLVPFSSGVRSAIFITTSVFCIGVIVYLLVSASFKAKWNTQMQNIKVDMSIYV